MKISEQSQPQDTHYIFALIVIHLAKIKISFLTANIAEESSLSELNEAGKDGRGRGQAGLGELSQVEVAAAEDVWLTYPADDEALVFNRAFHLAILESEGASDLTAARVDA